MNNFQNNHSLNRLTEKDTLEQKYNNTRASLLYVVVFSVINLLTTLFQTGIYFLFSAYMPLFVVDLGMLLCGKYSSEFYVDELANMEFLGTPFFVATIIIAFLIISLYLLCWHFSKNHNVGWLIFALMLFSADTLLMLLINGIDLSMLLDMIFHGWVIFSLVNGIIAHNKLAKLPMILPDSFPVADFGSAEESDRQGSEETQTVTNSAPLRMANLDEKTRVFAEADAFGHKITYRRIKRTNELVIDGYVYDEYEALVEFEHSLFAIIDGHKIEAGFDGVSKSFVKINGVEIASERRGY